MQGHETWLLNAMYVLLVGLASLTIWMLKSYHKRIEQGFASLGTQIAQVNHRVVSLAQRVSHIEGRLGISAGPGESDSDSSQAEPG